MAFQSVSFCEADSRHNQVVVSGNMCGEAESSCLFPALGSSFTITAYLLPLLISQRHSHTEHERHTYNLQLAVLVAWRPFSGFLPCMADTELPVYSPRPIRPRRTDTNPFKCQHKLHLENNKGRVWITLLINSRSQNPSNMPMFFDQDVISGEVHLDIDRPENIKGLTITVSYKPWRVMNHTNEMICGPS